MIVRLKGWLGTPLTLSAFAAALLLCAGISYQLTHKGPNADQRHRDTPARICCNASARGRRSLPRRCSTTAEQRLVATSRRHQRSERPSAHRDVWSAGADENALIGRLPQGWEEGPISIPIFSPDRNARPPSGRLCLRSTGSASVLLGGEADGAPARVDGQPAEGRVSVVASSKETDKSCQSTTRIPKPHRTRECRLGRAMGRLRSRRLSADFVAVRLDSREIDCDRSDQYSDGALAGGRCADGWRCVGVPDSAVSGARRDLPRSVRRVSADFCPPPAERPLDSALL